jgi:hypothetical protein
MPTTTQPGPYPHCVQWGVIKLRDRGLMHPTPSNPQPRRSGGYRNSGTGASFTRNPEPDPFQAPASCTLHPAPCTLHPEPCTPNPEPETVGGISTRGLGPSECYHPQPTSTPLCPPHSLRLIPGFGFRARVSGSGFRVLVSGSLSLI